MTKVSIEKTELINDDKFNFEKLMKHHDLKTNLSSENDKELVYSIECDEATIEDILMYTRIPWNFK